MTNWVKYSQKRENGKMRHTKNNNNNKLQKMRFPYKREKKQEKI